MLEEKENCFEYIPEEFHEFIVEEDAIYTMNYPVLEFPLKVKSVGFDKLPIIESKLLGIKGQYLYLENNQVLNIRKHTGYYIKLYVAN